MNNEAIIESMRKGINRARRTAQQSLEIANCVDPDELLPDAKEKFYEIRSSMREIAKSCVPKTVTTRPPVISFTQPLARKLPTVAPTVAAEPKLSPAAIRSLEFATKCMGRKDWSPNQRRLAAFHHLQKDPLTATLNPDQLLS